MQLEKRAYPREEIASIIGVDPKNQNFKRRVTDTLTKWGYEFIYKCKAVTITKVPETAQDRLKELVIRRLNVDIRCDTMAFALFCYLMWSGDFGFDAMPWELRSKTLEKEFDVTVSDRTLKTWASKLISQNLMTKTKDTETRALWVSFYVDGVKYQEFCDLKNDDTIRANYVAYCDYRKKLLDENGGDWTDVPKKLWDKFQECFYYCYTTDFNAIVDDDVKEIFRLVEEIVEENYYK